MRYLKTFESLDKNRDYKDYHKPSDMSTEIEEAYQKISNTIDSMTSLDQKNTLRNMIDNLYNLYKGVWRDESDVDDLNDKIEYLNSRLSSKVEKLITSSYFDDLKK